MNNSEVNEIRKTFSSADASTLDYLRAQYVSPDTKEVIADEKVNLHTLEENDMLSYLNLLKKAMTGKIGKALSNVEIPNKIRMDECLPEVVLDGADGSEAEDRLLEIVRTNVLADANFVIFLARGAYDIPEKTTDNQKTGESDEVYSYIFMAVCPVKSTKGGITYDAFEKKFAIAAPLSILDAPITGFLYPAFTDRHSDRADALVYTKKQAQNDMVAALFGNTAPGEEEQKNAFTEILHKTLGETPDFGVVSEINNKINEKIDNADKSEGEVKLEKEDLKAIFEESGASVENFDASFEENVPEGHIVAQAVAEKSVRVDAPDIAVTAKNLDAAKLIRQQTIDGSRCLVIELTDNHVTLNGTDVLA